MAIKSIKRVIGKPGGKQVLAKQKYVSPGAIKGGEHVDWLETESWGDWTGGGGKQGAVSNPARGLSRGALKRNIKR